jgi:hypothetical protein
MIVKTKTVKLAVTVLHEGEYREPGTPITLAIEEANDLLARFGSFEDILGDSASPKQREADTESVATLNRFHRQLVK